MADLNQAMNVLAAKTMLSEKIEAMAVQMYFSPAIFNKDADTWKEVLIAWEDLKNQVNLVTPPASPPATSP